MRKLRIISVEEGHQEQKEIELTQSTIIHSLQVISVENPSCL